MTDISNAADLLETAREALLREVLPALPHERRYVARMVANAMGIGAREQRLEPVAASSEAARLRALLDAAGRPPSVSAERIEAGSLRALRVALCRAIRAGAFDSPEQASALSAALADTAHDRVAISNPKALQAEGDLREQTPMRGTTS